MSLVARLRAVARRLRRCLCIEGLAWVVAFLVVACAVDLMIDYTTRGVRWSIRLAMLLSILGGFCWMTWRRIVDPLRHRIGEAEVANLLERRHPQLGSLLISAVRFSQGDFGPPDRNSPSLAASVVAQVGGEVRDLDFGGVVNAKRFRFASAILLSSLVVASAAMIHARDTMGLWFARNVLLQEVDWPKRTHLIVELDGDTLIGARGDDLVINAHALGVQPRAVEITFETTGGQRGRESMVTVGSAGNYRYRYVFKNAREDFTFSLRGGDDTTPRYRARLLERPHVTTTQMRIVAPAYTRLDAVTLGDGQRAAQVLPGSKVTIRARTNHPVVSATIMAGEDRNAEAVWDGEDWVATLTPAQTHTYHFALLDEAGLENRRPVRFSLRVVKDEAPRVRMRLPDVGDMITPRAVLPIELEFADAYGIAEATVTYRISREGQAEGTIDLEGFHPGGKTFSVSLAWPVSSLDLVPGEILTLSARAQDFDDVSGPNSAQTPEVTLRVVTREELLSELARREQEYRINFERTVDSQERVRGKLLSALGRFQKGAKPESLSADLAPLERRQRNIAGSVNVIRQQFEQSLAQLHINQLDPVDERKRLLEGIIEPLTQLAKRDLVAAADAVRAWSRETSAEWADRIDPQQVTILTQMRNALANMIQWEGYQEVVTMLRDIIRLQKELQAETKKNLEKEASDVFDN